MLGVDERAVSGHVEHAPAALDELGLNAEFSRNFSRQTGGTRKVASARAVLDGDAHDDVREVVGRASSSRAGRLFARKTP